MTLYQELQIARTGVVVHDVMSSLLTDEYTEFGCYGTVLSLVCSGQNVIQVNALQLPEWGDVGGYLL